MITSLIDKKDTCEIVRAKIESILATEIASQKALAGQANKDPTQWDLTVYSERANPIEQVLNDSGDVTPIVSVSYDGTAFNKGASAAVQKFNGMATYNLDCYGFGQSQDAAGGGHTPGDYAAAISAHRAVRLVRNILSADIYTYLGLPGVVWSRWVQSVSMFQPPEANTVQRVLGARVVLNVAFDEHAPQFVGCPLEEISVSIERNADGLVYSVAEFDYT